MKVYLVKRIARDIEGNWELDQLLFICSTLEIANSRITRPDEFITEFTVDGDADSEQLVLNLQSERNSDSELLSKYNEWRGQETEQWKKEEEEND